MRKLKMVLLVDDDPINNFINKRLLDKLGLAEKVHILKNGQEALDFIRENLESGHQFPELIILDNHMPVMDGIGFMEHLNEANLIKQYFIILALVAASTQEDVEKFKLLGVHELSFKPLSEELLMEIYNRYWATA